VVLFSFSTGENLVGLFIVLFISVRDPSFLLVSSQSSSSLLISFFEKLFSLNKLFFVHNSSSNLKFASLSFVVVFCRLIVFLHFPGVFFVISFLF
jgi:hypothetical protein